MFGLRKRKSCVEQRTPMEIRWYNGKEKDEQVEKKGGGQGDRERGGKGIAPLKGILTIDKDKR